MILYIPKHHHPIIIADHSPVEKTTMPLAVIPRTTEHRASIPFALS
jgi:hypothetical protein